MRSRTTALRAEGPTGQRAAEEKAVISVIPDCGVVAALLEEEPVVAAVANEDIVACVAGEAEGNGGGLNMDATSHRAFPLVERPHSRDFALFSSRRGKITKYSRVLA